MDYLAISMILVDMISKHLLHYFQNITLNLINLILPGLQSTILLRTLMKMIITAYLLLVIQEVYLK